MLEEIHAPLAVLLRAPDEHVGDARPIYLTVAHGRLDLFPDHDERLQQIILKGSEDVAREICQLRTGFVEIPDSKLEMIILE
jgi:hypothetical protein